MTAALVDIRAKAAALLAPVADSDPDVHVDLVDALTPPCLIVGWGEPWLEARTPCLFDARLVITAVAGRIEPGPGVATLETLVSYTWARFASANGYALEGVTGPRQFVIAGVTYLGARLTFRVSATIERGL